MDVPVRDVLAPGRLDRFPFGESPLRVALNGCSERFPLDGLTRRVRPTGCSLRRPVDGPGVGPVLGVVLAG